MTLEELKQTLCDQGHEDSVVLENPDYSSAVIGVTNDGNVVYSYPLMVESLVKEDGMTEEEAMEFIDYNTIRALPYMGDLHPIVFHPLEEY